MKRFIFLTTLFSLLVPTSRVSGDTLDFFQLDFDLAGNVIQDSDWGAVDFTYQGQDPIMYFNLDVNGSWQAQNIPVLSKDGVGVAQTMRYYFSLGVLRGTDVSTLNYGYSFSSDILSGMPSISSAAAVLTDWYVQGSGFLSSGASDLAAAGPLIGDRASSPVKHFVTGMPNNEAKSNACAPTAFANSLQFLNTTKGLNLQNSQISVDKLEQVVGYNPATATISSSWYTLKRDYANKLGITTRWTSDIASLVNEIDGKQDIELVYGWGPATNRHAHMLVMTGITRLENGNYSIDTKDDGRQGQPGGLNETTWIYDPNTKEMKSAMYGAVTLDYAVIECPEPATVMLLGLLGAFALFLRWRKETGNQRRRNCLFRVLR